MTQLNKRTNVSHQQPAWVQSGTDHLGSLGTHYKCSNAAIAPFSPAGQLLLTITNYQNPSSPVIITPLSLLTTDAFKYLEPRLNKQTLKTFINCNSLQCQKVNITLNMKSPELCGHGSGTRQLVLVWALLSGHELLPSTLQTISREH